MPDEQFDEVAELLDRKVCRERSLTALLADDTNTDIGGLDHGDVVSTVADAAHAFLGVGADEAGDVGFLGRAAAAGDYGGKLDCDGDEFGAIVG